MNRAKIPVAEYEQLTKQWNPVKFNADAWVQMAKDTGMKYIVITSKHHDGFALYQSKASRYNVFDATPFKRDILKELVAACRKQGMRLAACRARRVAAELQVSTAFGSLAPPQSPPLALNQRPETA